MMKTTATFALLAALAGALVVTRRRLREAETEIRLRQLSERRLLEAAERTLARASGEISHAAVG